jgi:RhoGAP domain
MFRLFSGLRSEGIYRVNGNTYNVDKLICRFKKSSNKVIKYPKYDEFDVASAFKKFIRDLPQPLLGDLSEHFLETSRK